MQIKHACKLNSLGGGVCLIVAFVLKNFEDVSGSDSAPLFLSPAASGEKQPLSDLESS